MGRKGVRRWRRREVDGDEEEGWGGGGRVVMVEGLMR